MSRYGVCPDYLIQELLGYTDDSWAKKRREWPFCKTFKGAAMVSLAEFEKFVATGSQDAAECDRPSERIGWDHPLCRAGIVPGYLIREQLGWTECTWKKKYRTWSFVKTLNGEPWVSLQGFEEYLRTADGGEDRPNRQSCRQARPAAGLIGGGFFHALAVTVTHSVIPARYHLP